MPANEQITDASVGRLTQVHPSDSRETLRMPLISRLVFTASAVGLTLGAHIADLSSSHMFNQRWPPHAKFHTGQTLSMSVLLSVLTIFFAWRKTSDQREAVFATAGFAAAYWVTQATAISYPNTAFYDPEFITAGSFPLGLPVQAYFQLLFLSLIR
jgi:hypothetical protein